MVAEIVIFVVDGDSVFVENGDARKAIDWFYFYTT